jgi:hypothetical protein
MKCGCVFWEFAKRKLATRKDKIRIIKSLSVSREDRCEVLACFHVAVKMYRYSLEERVFIVKTYWITGWIKNCQKRFVEWIGGRNPASKRCIQLLVAGCVVVSLRVDYLIFSCCQLPFSEFPKHTTALHYRYDMQMYCTFVLFVNQHFPGLPASGTHCICTFWEVGLLPYWHDSCQKDRICILF